MSPKSLKTIFIACALILPQLLKPHKLGLKKLPSFQESRTLNFIEKNKLSLDDASRFSMVKLRTASGRLTLIFLYNFQKQTCLARKTQTSNYAWVHVDEVNPFEILSYNVTKHTDDRLKRLIDAIPFGETKGVNPILDHLNSIDWDKALLKAFYKGSVFPRLHVSEKPRRTQEVALTRLMLKSSCNFNPNYIGFPSVIVTAEKQGQITRYVHVLAGFYSQMVERLFFHQLHSQEFNIFHFVNNPEATTSHYPKVILDVFPKLIEFREKTLKSIESLKSVLSDFFSQDLPSFYFDQYEELETIYNAHLKPMFTEKVFPIFSVLFQKVKQAGSEKEYQKIIKKLQEQFEFTVFPAVKKNMELSFLSDVITGFCLDTFKRYTTEGHDYSRINRRLNKLWKFLVDDLFSNLKPLTSLDMDKAKQIVGFHRKEFERLFINMSPTVVSFSDTYRVKNRNLLFAFFDSKFYHMHIDTRGSRDFLQQVLHFASFLGGRSQEAETLKLDDMIPFGLIRSSVISKASPRLV